MPDPTIPPQVLAKILAHRPDLGPLAANLGAHPAIARTLAANYLAGDLGDLTPAEAWGLASVSEGLPYNPGGRPRDRHAADWPARIRAERERLGLTQEACAARIGVGRGSYRQLEEATADPRVATLIALVRDAGMDPRALAPELFGA